MTRRRRHDVDAAHDTRRRVVRVVVLVVVLALTAVLTFLAIDRQPSAAECVPGERRVAFIGDSYTSGAGTDSGADHRFPALLDQEIPSKDQVLGFNGSGYVARGPAPYDTTFPEAAREVNPSTDLVVVFGSRNDAPPSGDVPSSGQISRAVTSTIKTIREQAPSAAVVIIGPPWINGDPPQRILRARDAVRDATGESANVQFVDPIDEGWFAEEDSIVDGKSTLIARDRIHPTDEGHEYLAQKMLPVVRPFLTCSKD